MQYNLNYRLLRLAGTYTLKGKGVIGVLSHEFNKIHQPTRFTPKTNVKHHPNKQTITASKFVSSTSKKLKARDLMCLVF